MRMLVSSYKPCNSCQGSGLLVNAYPTTLADSQCKWYFYYNVFRPLGFSYWKRISTDRDVPYGVWYPGNPAKQGQHTRRAVSVDKYISTRVNIHLSDQYKNLYTARCEQQEVPQAIQQHPCDFFNCSDSYGYFNITKFWDVHADSSIPCNLPDAPPYRYRKWYRYTATAYFLYTKFDVYRQKLWADKRWQSDSCYNGCFRALEADYNYKVQPVAIGVTDVQLLQSGLLQKLEYGFWAQQDGWYAYAKYIAGQTNIPSTLSTAQTQWFSSYMDSKCPVYFIKQAPWTRCSCRYPGSDSQTTQPSPVLPYMFVGDWYRLGYVYPKQLQNVTFGKWCLLSTPDYSGVSVVVQQPPGTYKLCNKDAPIPPPFQDYQLHYLEYYDLLSQWKNYQGFHNPPQGFAVPFEHKTKTVKAVVFHVDLDADAYWDDSPLFQETATTQSRAQCLAKRNRTGDGSIQNPFKNLNYATQLAYNALPRFREKNFVEASCGVWVVFKCTGEAHYGTACFSPQGTIQEAFLGGLVLDGAKIRIEKATYKGYVCSYFDCLYNCNIVYKTNGAENPARYVVAGYKDTYNLGADKSPQHQTVYNCRFNFNVATGIPQDITGTYLLSYRNIIDSSLTMSKPVVQRGRLFVQAAGMSNCIITANQTKVGINANQLLDCKIYAYIGLIIIANTGNFISHPGFKQNTMAYNCTCIGYVNIYLDLFFCTIDLYQNQVPIYFSTQPGPYISNMIIYDSDITITRFIPYKYRDSNPIMQGYKYTENNLTGIWASNVVLHLTTDTHIETYFDVGRTSSSTIALSLQNIRDQIFTMSQCPIQSDMLQNTTIDIDIIQPNKESWSGGCAQYVFSAAFVNTDYCTDVTLTANLDIKYPKAFWSYSLKGLVSWLQEPYFKGVHVNIGGVTAYSASDGTSKMYIRGVDKGDCCCHDITLSTTASAVHTCTAQSGYWLVDTSICAFTGTGCCQQQTGWDPWNGDLTKQWCY